MNRWKKFLLLSTSISIAAIIIIMALTIDVESMKYVSRISPLFVLLAFLLHFLSVLVVSIKLKLLTKSIGYRISLKRGIEITFASGFLAAITPSQVGGEPLRIKMLSEETGSGNATAVVFGERVMDVLFFLAAVPFIIVLFGGMGIIKNPIGYIVGGSLFIMLVWSIIWIGVIRPHIMKRIIRRILLFVRKFFKEKRKIDDTLAIIEKEIDHFSRSFKEMFRKKAYFSTGIFLTAILWILDFSIPSVLLMGFGLKPIWAYSIFAQILITMIALIPITPGASGIYEVSILAFYTSFLPTPIIGIFILLWRLSTYYFNLVAGGLISINAIKKYGKDEYGT